jgi:hypothetical protein
MITIGSTEGELTCWLLDNGLHTTVITGIFIVSHVRYIPPEKKESSFPDSLPVVSFPDQPLVVSFPDHILVVPFPYHTLTCGTMVLLPLLVIVVSFPEKRRQPPHSQTNSCLWSHSQTPPLALPVI